LNYGAKSLNLPSAYQTQSQEMKKLWLESALITVFVFMLLWGANTITDLKLFTDFDPISQAISSCPRKE